ncbi:DUF748 domain-containing protein [Oxalobacteraceae bacterium]|nr:DUF748 domain-containing protein [Oxalobacteraceae bacterium]
MQLKNVRWKRWAAGAAGVVAVYGAAGYWLLPQLISSQLPAFVQTELERKASVGEVSFNPFTLRLQLRDLRLSETNDTPLFALGGLVVELNWSSMLHRAWHLAEIRLSAPALHLAIAPDGKFNVSELLATWEKRHHEKTPDTGMPRLIIDHFALEQGKVEMQDRQAGYTESFTPINFALDNLSTLPEHDGNHRFAADAVHGGKLEWRGKSSLSPIRGEGELTLDKLALPGLAAYLKSTSLVRLTQGQLSAKLPYKFAYANGKFDASLNGALLALHDIGLRRGETGSNFTDLKLFELSGVDLDLRTRAASVAALKVEGGQLSLKRDAKGELDLANLTVPVANATPAGMPPLAGQGANAETVASVPASASVPTPAAKTAAPAPWKLQFKQVAIDQLAINMSDASVSPALTLNAASSQLRMQLSMEQGAGGFKLNIGDAGLSFNEVVLANGAQKHVQLGELGLTEGALDLAARSLTLGRLYADGGQVALTRDAQGQFTIVKGLPKSGAAEPANAASVKTAAAKTAAASATPAETQQAAWQVSARSVELNKFGLKLDDKGTGIQANVQDLHIALTGASSNLAQPLQFDAGLSVREGGSFTAKGKLVPSTAAFEAEVALKQLALAPVQPLLSQHLKLKLAGGSLSARGRLTSGNAAVNKNDFSYAGSVEVAGLALNEEDGDPFAAWKSVRADKVNFSLGPDMLEIPELRIVEPNAKLIIENDRSFNASRLLVQGDGGKAASTGAVTAAAGVAAASVSVPANANASRVASQSSVAVPTPAATPFPVRVRRVRLQNAKLDFTDLSLRPQFSAKIYELNGVVSGLSSKKEARSQIELDGRVDEFGQARVRGQLNPFAPSDNTDLNVVFKNVDMVSASPYTMKFAGYKIAEGKISLDLQYKVRKNQLEGNNQIVFDKLTLGERADSPDALQIPLALALAILKDSDGRIDLGLPVSGDMNDPQFSYGSVVWKALGNVLSKIVTSPFRALGSLLGVSGDKLEAIDFDAGSAALLPPEQEKLRQVAKILAARQQLNLSVPGHYSEAADGMALKTRALRHVVATRAGIKMEAGEEPGPLDLGTRSIRGAVRALYAERFGDAELDKQKKLAEAAAPGGAAKPSASSAVPAAPAATQADAGAKAVAATAAAQQKLPIWQRVGKLIQGEPQVADATAFYDGLWHKLEQQQPLAPDALSKLGSQRSAAILAALKDAGVAPASATAGTPQAISAEPGKLVPLTLGLSAK